METDGILNGGMENGFRSLAHPNFHFSYAIHWQVLCILNGGKWILNGGFHRLAHLKVPQKGILTGGKETTRRISIPPFSIETEIEFSL